MGKLHRLLEIEHHDIVAAHVQELAAHMALVVCQNDGIDGRAGSAGSARQDFRGAIGQEAASGLGGSSPADKSMFVP
ncbi:hypothetical protein GCM10007923_23860 [Shinella yambaruensis]|uniref:Uncharacterized protein n=1 Tax=Shinella yambaruensis TaxID=415996 RepID=A0ABQ5ZEE1_9HYPH|nr:hypothetical protein GCM10007923_23860 [Shinella yambaruensis]